MGLTVLVSALACLAATARPAGASPPVTITLLSQALYQPAFTVLIQNFERVNPSITVQPSGGVVIACDSNRSVPTETRTFFLARRLDSF